MNTFKTEQETFWAQEFGNEYIERNKEDSILASNISFFADILKHTNSIDSVIEFGANIGLNLKAMSYLLPKAELSAVEINQKAVEKLKSLTDVKIYHQSIIDFKPDYNRDLVITKGVLIHINPDFLSRVYELIYHASNKYICIAEYYNPVPVELVYRGHHEKLFKRDFAGEILDKYSNIRLVDYGFAYHRDEHFPQDDINWFLLEKK